MERNKRLTCRPREEDVTPRPNLLQYLLLLLRAPLIRRPWQRRPRRRRCRRRHRRVVHIAANGWKGSHSTLARAVTRHAGLGADGEAELSEVLRRRLAVAGFHHLALESLREWRILLCLLGCALRRARGKEVSEGRGGPRSSPRARGTYQSLSGEPILRNLLFGTLGRSGGSSWRLRGRHARLGGG